MKTALRFEALERLEKMHGPAIKCQPMISSELDEYAEKLPDILLDFWTKYGWCGFAKGFLWFVNPNDYSYIHKEWLNSDLQDSFVFARTAFGDLFFLSGSTVYILRVQEGKARDLADDFSYFILGS